MTSIDQSREELTHLLGRVEQWYDGLYGLADHAPDAAELAAGHAQLRSLRTRALSNQLNVGLLGRQSAGKSFLISGLQGGLQYFRFTDEEGDFSEEYLGILPSSANPTTACPSTVVPVQDDASVDASGRGLLRVRFSDADWLDIGTSLPPTVVSAYGAADGRTLDRLDPSHYARHVEEMELLISDFRLPAKLYDLPGAESVIEEHNVIMRKAWKDADCFIYVSQGTSALTIDELDLIRELYAEHLKTGKRVLWVLTGIDRASQMERGQAAWKSVLATNNTYLRDHFARSPRVRESFIGEGFIPVSAAWEAQADFEDENGGDGGSLRRRGRMDALRQRLTELIDSGAGQFHLAQVADEARLLVRRRQRPIEDLVAAHQVSSAELRKQEAAVSNRIDRLAGAVERLDTHLRKELERRIRAVHKPFQKLSGVLHDHLDALIDGGNLKPDHVSRINIRTVETFARWMAAPDGPDAVWRKQMAELDASARRELRVVLEEDSAGPRLVTPEPFDPNAFLTTSDGRRTVGVYGLVKATAATVGVASPIVGGVAVGVAGVSLSAIAFPVAASVGAAIAVAKIVDAFKERESAIERERNERKRLVDSQAERARTDFAAAAEAQALRLIDAVEDHVEQYRSRLQDTLAQIKERIRSPDNVMSLELVSRLGPVDASAKTLMADLQALSEDAQR